MPDDHLDRPQRALLVIGGAEDKLRTRAILKRFVELADGGDACIAVVATASSLGDEIVDLYRAVFTELGAREVIGMRPLTREEANAPDLAAQMARVTGIFMTGGNQLRLATVVGGTRLGRAILEAHGRGAVVGGTSAGASAVGTHMVAFGASGDVPKQRMGQLSAGLGLLPDVIVDQHFGQRNRIGRLMQLVAHSPSHLGVGLDEDTAAIIDGDGVLEVLGRGVVLIVDGTNLDSNAFAAKRTEALMVSGAVLHALPSGYRFDLHERRLLPRPEEPRKRASRRMTSQRGVVTPIEARLVQRVAAEGADDTAPERAARRATRRHAADPAGG